MSPDSVAPGEREPEQPVGPPGARPGDVDEAEEGHDAEAHVTEAHLADQLAEDHVWEAHLSEDHPAEIRPTKARVTKLLRSRASREPSEVRAQAERTLGQVMADRLTAGAGSWGFILTFLAFVALWMVVNVVAALRHWDPYPFILLNLVLSCVAAIQAPVILMSQNREEARDRVRAEADYQVNLKAELLLENLTHEVEHLKAMLAERQEAGAKDDSAA